MKYSIVIVSPAGYVHAEAFREMAQALESSLIELKHDAVIETNFASSDRQHIVLGSNLLPKLKVEPPPGAILYNLEQVDLNSKWLTPELIDLFKRHRLWDYSPRNIEALRGFGITNVQLVPVGYSSCLTRISPAREDIDVLFYGSMNPRRQAIIDELRGRDLQVETLFGVYGADRDAAIARSRLVLSLHFYEAKIFEIIRVSYLLANKKAVVAERGIDRGEETAFEAGVAFANYHELVDRCVHLLQHPQERQRLADAGYQLMTTRKEADYVANAIGAAAIPAYWNYSRPELVAKIPAAGARILEVGCAAGAMGAALLDKGAMSVVGLEQNKRAAAIARSRLSAVYCVDLNTLPVLPYPDGFFDVIVCADVLEHLVDPPAVLKYLRRYLSDTGMVVTSIPNVRHESVVMPLLVDGRWHYGDAGILDATHMRFYTATEIEELFNAAGYSIEEPVDANDTAPSEKLKQLAKTVAQLGGDAERFLTEGSVVQYVLNATPIQSLAELGHVQCTVERLNQWEGSQRMRVLLAPDLSNPIDTWETTLGGLLAEMTSASGVTIAVALPAAEVDTPPEAFRRFAASAQCDLLLTELPSDAIPRERLWAGAAVYVQTSPREDLANIAQKVGVEIHSGTTGQPIAAGARGFNETERRYLDVMKRILMNTIYEDAQLTGSRSFEPGKRDVGLDWPSVAHTMIGRKRLDNLEHCIEAVLADGISGDFIETGVWRGGATIFMRAALGIRRITDRRVFVADSFEGLPPPDSNRYPADAGDVHHTVRELAVSIDQVKSNFARYGLLDEQVVFLKGWFKDSLPTAPITQLAIARLDGDMYESTMDALISLYPKLAVGGFLIVDDFGAVPACRKAVEDYRRQHKIAEPIVPIDWTGVFWRRVQPNRPS